MRKEPFTAGDYIHVLKRGAKKLPIVKDESDRWRFLKVLRHLNDEFTSEHWESEIEKNIENKTFTIFDRPQIWPDARPLVSIVAHTLMPNHFHLLLKEIRKGGVASFMQKLGNSMTGHFNLKYKEVGSIFQGSYKAKRISEDRYLRYLAVYIMVKNVFELYPGGLEVAAREFNKAFDWAKEYHFSSLYSYAHSAQVKPAQIIQKEILGEIFTSPQEFKTFARECILGRVFKDNEELAILTME